MKELSGSELLDIWERGYKTPMIERALLLLFMAMPESKPLELSKLPIGRRDALLLQMLERHFGTQLAARVTCPSCEMELELEIRTKDLKYGDLPQAEVTGRINIEGYNIAFRLPDSQDLQAASKCSAIESAGIMLIGRCIIQATKDGKQIPFEDIPPFILEEISNRMGEMDPQANIQINLICPSCEHKWSSRFDVALFLWTLIDALARCSLREVHILATSYGWTEKDILGMSRQRRSAYMEILGL
jgi:hypothetical protein